MQHYLRQGLLTLVTHPEPQTVIELIRVLTDDAFRDRYLDYVDDPMLAAFWQTEWPGPRDRDRDTSIKAVLNKLGHSSRTGRFARSSARAPPPCDHAS